MDDCLTLTKFNMLYQVSLSIQYHSLQFVLEQTIVIKKSNNDDHISFIYLKDNIQFSSI